MRSNLPDDTYTKYQIYKSLEKFTACTLLRCIEQYGENNYSSRFIDAQKSYDEELYEEISEIIRWEQIRALSYWFDRLVGEETERIKDLKDFLDEEKLRKKSM
jgi:hypothetical protein